MDVRALQLFLLTSLPILIAKLVVQNDESTGFAVGLKSSINWRKQF